MTPNDALRAARGDTVLERLRYALRSVRGETGEEWDFGDWNQCTCGHIYLAAVGKPAGGSIHPITRPEEETYVQLLGTVLIANDALPPWLLERAYAEQVSDLTINLARTLGMTDPDDGDPTQEAYRAAAVQLLERAVAYEGERHEDARRRILRVGLSGTRPRD